MIDGFCFYVIFKYRNSVCNSLLDVCLKIMFFCLDTRRLEVNRIAYGDWVSF